MRDAVPPCEMRYRGEAGRRTRTPPQQPSGREGPARADRHRNLHAPRLQNHPPNNLPALRLDPGLCNRFGQTASLRPPGWAARVAATAPGRPRRRDVHFALESAVPTVILECEMHLSRAECTSRRRGGRAGPSSRTAATVPLAPPRARQPAPSRRSRPARGTFWRERPTEPFSPGRPPDWPGSA